MRIESILSLFLTASDALAQDTIRYTGNTLVNVDYHHGQLSPAVGVHNIQVFRANPGSPEKSAGLDWTYNHDTRLVYWNGLFYLESLCCPVGEHIPPGPALNMTSNSGNN